jgi:hypothetical protein
VSGVTPAAFLGIQHVSTVVTRPEPAPARSAPEDARKRFELLQDCREMVISRLSRVIGEALTKMGEELASVALKSRNPEEQRALMDAVSVVRQHRTEIELRFRRSFTDVFERRLFNQQPAASDDRDEPAELALVDEHEMQAKLAVDRLVHRSRGKLDPDEVLGMRARLAALLEREWFEEDHHPASPEAVFEALKSSLSELAPRPEVQSALLDAFEPHVSSSLNQVYSTVNERLRTNQVLPKIRPQVAVQAGQRKPSPDATGLPDLQLAAAPGAPARPGVTGGAQAGVAVPGGGAASSPSAAQVQSVLSDLMLGSPGARASATRMLSDPDLFALADLPIPAVEPPLLDALSSLQASSAAVPLVPADLIAHVNDRARESGSPLDQLTVEIVSMVFDYIYADKQLADVVKQQLLRLQVVAIKAALIDRSFFARRQHPMRRLIDRITEVASDPDAGLAVGAPLLEGLTEVVEWVLVTFDRDLSTFDEARERIDLLAAEEASRRAEQIAQLTREAERSESVAHARGLARARLADRLEADTPAFVREFLEEWWSLALAEAQVGSESAPIGFDEGLAVGEGLIWSVTPKVADEVPKLAALLPRLINGLMRGVRLVGMPDERRESFFNELLKAHTRAIEAAKQAAAAARKPSNLRMRPDGKIQFTPIATAVEAPRAEPPPAEAHTVRLGELRRGDTIELDLGDGQFSAYKLAWVSPAQRLYVLSRYPNEARSLERANLASLFDAGRARVAQPQSTVEQAIRSVAPTAGDERAAA